MISPAINQADRLSGCNKALRRVLDKNDQAFNFHLYVCQTANGHNKALSEDEIVLRYNVNGIELNEAGFEKLAAEIDLKTINCLIPEIQKDPIIIHTGKFPLVTGGFQRLIVREDWVLELNQADMNILGIVNRKYYEVWKGKALFYKVLSESRLPFG
jgi:hypothetical protein